MKQVMGMRTPLGDVRSFKDERGERFGGCRNDEGALNLASQRPPWQTNFIPTQTAPYNERVKTLKRRLNV